MDADFVQDPSTLSEKSFAQVELKSKNTDGGRIWIINI